MTENIEPARDGTAAPEADAPGRRIAAAERAGPAAVATDGPSEPTNQRESETSLTGWFAYQLDLAQRAILFLDVLRKRADNMIDHEQAGLPPVLAFNYETLLDARSFDPPANYALLRILAVGDACLEECVDPAKPPVIVIDPRAGHGPGIGGFKRDSEVGIAMHEGHPVYFVSFYPEPCPGQTLADVQAALRGFVEAVAARHPEQPPVLYGNCQAGWAVALLAADCAGLSGPAVLNGSPLSYWAGEPGVNPMRLLGGLTGGTWLAHFIADLDGGRFDGAWLAQNFEGLKPEKAVWDKYANLFADPDGERERFLNFERWWNGFYALSREEILAILQNLFIGNRLEAGKIRLCEGCYVDLRRIRNPLVVFASHGDDITPPHQALGWIPAVYESTEDLKAAGQRIVYLTNPHVGHLGIFVSAGVARLEHRAILESLADIEGLAPGLYEMKIDNPTGDPDCRRPQYSVRFEERLVEDLAVAPRNAVFERVREISELNEATYRTFVSPWVRATATPWTSAMLRWLHPMRASRLVFSERLNPAMAAVEALARATETSRVETPEGSPYAQAEAALSEAIEHGVEAGRRFRDTMAEASFEQLYGAAGTSGRSGADR